MLAHSIVAVGAGNPSLETVGSNISEYLHMLCDNDDSFTPLLVGHSSMDCSFTAAMEYVSAPHAPVAPLDCG